ncbi:uncharacterized protein BX664DRAFT_381684 [Halteromyces radiatus]|uniref:uncharacterized protein n=1 Tax=Halteromyces radiatus TaxID=101107 RepID=UPI0022211599|nr:uncharacterized protein BX664DRAFT_381684 [Halteromyces radiatus]KAI8099072.1 hypothetical protein BX664DRAFT_381684 [Halteromyces radiatus]
MDTSPFFKVFSTERPKDGIELMQTRLRSALKLNDELADYFKERAIVEDLYAKNLSKLNKKLFITDKSALGIMLPAWERIQNELHDTAIIHSTFATKMVDDIEKSLRSAIINDQVYAEIRRMDPTFQKLAKDYDDRQLKLVKHKKTIDKAGKKPSDAENKYNEAKKQLDIIKEEWQQYSSKYIQLFQSVDEHRWHDIKNYLLQFETLQTDQMLKRVQLAGDNLASVSDFTVENEIMAFCTQYEPTTTTTIKSQNVPTTTSSMPPISTVSPSSSSSMPTSPPSTNEPTSPYQSSSFTPSLLIDTSDDPVQPQSTKSSESITSRTTTGTRTLPSVIEDADYTHSTSRPNAPSIKSNKKSDKQRKFLSSFTIRRKSKAIGTNGVMLPDIPDFTMQPSAGKASSIMDNASIHSIQEDDKPTTTTPTTTTDNQQQDKLSHSLHTPTLRKTTSFADSFFNQSPPSHQQQQQHHKNTPPDIIVDEEGFSIPPPDRLPWTTSPTSDTMTSEQDSSDLTSMDSASLYGTPRIKLDIKNDSVIQEDAKTSQVALTRVASMLKESNPGTSKRPRGRRELRSQYLQGNTLSIYQTSSSSPLAISAISETETNDNQKPTSTKPIISPFAHDDDDDYSIQESMVTPTLEETVNSLDLASPTNYKMTTSSISIRIKEVIHAQLQQGKSQRMMVMGEMAILYEGVNDEPVHFILKQDGLQMTSLVDYITCVEQVKEGMVYRLDPKMMKQQKEDYKICFKYQQEQQREDDDQQQSSHSSLVAPLLVKPMWKCDGDQARLMIKYNLSNKQNGPLCQVMMVTHVGGGCHGAQSMPTGQWTVDQQRMMWQLDNVKDQEEQVIRAKFATTSQAEIQPIMVRFEMENQLVSHLQVIEQIENNNNNNNSWVNTLVNIKQVEKNTRSGKYIAQV